MLSIIAIVVLGIFVEISYRFLEIIRTLSAEDINGNESLQENEPNLRFSK